MAGCILRLMHFDWAHDHILRTIGGLIVSVHLGAMVWAVWHRDEWEDTDDE